ncbi:hypothetical protein MK805_00715 [Shimazuella sp. AN120528]|uniref:hypothetical protein n=1 Tax=Shimazuella soli TaxID=1892854 RepID=UPI001F0D2A48|nr:hypothetical protein [Shimazuella soli]MCH5583492.1 hypothetical protein [Shimazuella soli]
MSEFGFTSLPSGFIPTVHDMGPLLPEWLQKAIDTLWERKLREAYNGRTYAAVVSDDAKDVFLWETSFAVRALRVIFKELEINVDMIDMTSAELDEAIEKISMTEQPDESIVVSVKLIGDVLKVKMDFKTVGMASIGLTPEGVAVIGNRHWMGASLFSGVLDELDLFSDARRQIQMTSGLPPHNLRIIGIVRNEVDKRHIHYVSVFDAPEMDECLRLFDLQKNMDWMDRFVFIPKGGVDEELSKHEDKWEYMKTALEAALKLV